MRELADTRAAKVIAVDGPTAAGKTTTSRRVAIRCGIPYLESGRAYRLVAWAALRREADLDDEDSLSEICDSLLEEGTYESILSATDDDAAFLRAREVTRAVSQVSSASALRNKVTALIRAWANLAPACVIEGRDIGTVVFPEAAVKVFLTASPEVRAKRRHAQEPGLAYTDILSDLLRRDAADSSRRHSPLVPGHDAMIIVTNDLPIEVVVGKIVRLCELAGVSRDEHIDEAIPCTS